MGSSCAPLVLLGSRARGAGALKVTPEAVEHTVPLPEHEPEATEAIERGALPSLGFVSIPGTDGGSEAVLLLQHLLDEPSVISKKAGS